MDHPEHPIETLLSASLFNSLRELRALSEMEFKAVFEPIPNRISAENLDFDTINWLHPVCLISGGTVLIHSPLPHGSVVIAPNVCLCSMPRGRAYIDANVLVTYGGRIPPEQAFGTTLRSSFGKVYLMGTEVAYGTFGSASVVRLPKLCFEAPKGALFVEETDLNPWHKAALGAMTFAEFDAFSRYQLDESDDNIALALHEHTRDFRMDFLTEDPVIAALKQVSFPIRRPLYSIPCLRDLASLPYDDRLALFSHRTPIECSRLIGQVFLEGYLKHPNPPPVHPVVRQYYHEERRMAKTWRF